MGDKVASSPVVTAASRETAAAKGGTPKKATVNSTKPRAKPTHPKTAEMVNTAIISLKEGGGSSLQAIKKYIAGTYKIDTEKQATFIRKYLKAAVASGALIQTKGKGAAGSFKVTSTKVDTAKPNAKPASKAKAPKKAQAAKKPVAAKKPTTTAIKKTPTKKATATAVSPKRKVTKGPAAKPPKPKTTKAKPATKSPVKKAKPAAAKKTEPVVAKPKKAAPKKAVAANK